MVVIALSIIYTVATLVKSISLSPFKIKRKKPLYVLSVFVLIFGFFIMGNVRYENPSDYNRTQFSTTYNNNNGEIEKSSVSVMPSVSDIIKNAKINMKELEKPDK